MRFCGCFFFLCGCHVLLCHPQQQLGIPNVLSGSKRLATHVLKSVIVHFQRDMVLLPCPLPLLVSEIKSQKSGQHFLIEDESPRSGLTSTHTSSSPSQNAFSSWWRQQWILVFSSMLGKGQIYGVKAPNGGNV